MYALKSTSRCRSICHEITARLKSSAFPETQEIQIPEKIERGPTDILQALESTLRYNEQIPMYKYMDDPFLYPLTGRYISSSELSRESGKRTAQWIFAHHPRLFPQSISDPVVKAFQPSIPIGDKNPSSEEKLLDAISQGNFLYALDHYKNLKDKLSNETKQSLLEFLCFTNSGKVDVTVRQPSYNNQKQKNRCSWWPNHETREIFQYLIMQDDVTAARAYNTMLCGTIKYRDINSALTLYRQCQEKQIKLNLTTRNYILDVLVHPCKDEDTYLAEVRKILAQMHDDGLQPNIMTLNNILRSILSYGTHAKLIDIVEKLIYDFEESCLQPSLGSYAYFIKLLKGKGVRGYSTFLNLIKRIQGRNFVIQDPADALFFHNAMTLAADEYCDIVLAQEIHRLFLTGQNCKLITDNEHRRVYYRKYLKLQLTTASIDSFFAFYRKIVPYSYMPEVEIGLAICDALVNSKNDISQYLSETWSEVSTYGLYANAEITRTLVGLMRLQKSLPPDSPLHKEYANAAMDVFNRIEYIRTWRLDIFEVKGPLLANIIILLLRNEQISNATIVMDFLHTQSRYITEQMSEDQVKEILEILIAYKHADGALALLKYVKNCDFPCLPSMARELYQTLPLTDAEKLKLFNMVEKTIIEAEVPDEK